MMLQNGRNLASGGAAVNLGTYLTSHQSLAEYAKKSEAATSLECAQPQTVTVPYQPFQAVPNCIAYQYGMYNGCNNLNGFWLLMISLVIVAVYL